ncbi:MAG: carboxypeptidase regulatory-like domain-containing protein, partial [Armatimonadetes bacterium]|nr:carboxypeptidase regulatory-like domain-containing protein [Armatimonadota bacterium]
MMRSPGWRPRHTIPHGRASAPFAAAGSWPSRHGRGSRGELRASLLVAGFPRSRSVARSWEQCGPDSGIPWPQGRSPCYHDETTAVSPLRSGAGTGRVSGVRTHTFQPEVRSTMAAALVFHTRARSTAVWPTLGLLACVGLGPSVRAAEAAEPQPLRVISGVVLRAEDGTPIADATVLPEGHDDSPWREAFDSRPVATDREGRFRLPIQAGTSRIAVFAPGYEAITLDAEENRQSGFVLRREARRTLQVVDRQGRGIPGVQLHLLWGSSALRDAADLPRPVVRGVTASARCARPTDSQGRTELRHMPPDAVVTLTLRDQPWILTTPPRVRELDVAGSSRHEPVVLQAEPAGSVEGRAVDASGEP